MDFEYTFDYINVNASNLYFTSSLILVSHWSLVIGHWSLASKDERQRTKDKRQRTRNKELTQKNYDHPTYYQRGRPQNCSSS